MDVRQLRYFVAAVEHKSVVRAAEALFLTQPTVSRTLQELEEELGKKLLIRGARQLSVTPEGELLYQRALLILDMVNATVSKIKESEKSLKGTVRLVMGETYLGGQIAKVFKSFHDQHPEVVLEITSGNEDTVTCHLEDGSCDFGLLVGSKARFNYQSLQLKGYDRWGIFVKPDHPLALKESVTVEELRDYELILSKQMLKNDELAGLFGSMGRFKIAVTYALPYNAMLMAEAGLGVLISFEHLIPVKDSGFIFVPLSPTVEVQSALVWKKGIILSPCAEAFLEELKKALSAG